MKKFFLLATLGLSLSSFADDIRLGQPGYGGTGCPAGSASATLSPDAKSLTLIFDSFVVQSGGANKRTDRKVCSITIPVHVPQGLSVSVFKIDYRGFNNLPLGSFSQFGVEYFFAGSAGPRVSKTFFGPTTDNYLLSSDLLGEAVTWSPCGQDVNLRAKTDMLVKTGRDMAEAMATLDSVDIKSGIQYHLQWQKC